VAPAFVVERQWLAQLAGPARVDSSPDLLQRAWHSTDNTHLSYWDALILAAAEVAVCEYLLSEDFQSGRRFGAIQVVNPFLTTPATTIPPSK
jgi:predicted nucleic acid-binding protein